ncbi:MAG TPA: hypothetical protein VNH17_02060 [Streptosporangiaceae bacterium]|nr:hypothetical protein [Streptosporangiaceae bacterium]
MNATFLVNLMTVTVLSPGLAAVFKMAWRSYNFYFGWLCGCLGGAIGFASGGGWPWMAADLANAGLAAVLWWLSRRRRKRAPRAYGAKSRALVEALVRRAREAARPRPVLRPVPGGAGA